MHKLTVWQIAVETVKSCVAVASAVAIPPLLQVGLAFTQTVAAPITTEVPDLADVPAGAATLPCRLAGGVGAAR